MGEGASMTGYGNERDKGILHSVEAFSINGVVTISISNAFASQLRPLRNQLLIPLLASTCFCC